MLETDRGRDVAGVDVGDLFTAVRVHTQQSAESLLLALRRVEQRLALRGMAGVDAEISQATHEGVAYDLERQRTERLVIIRGPLLYVA